LLFLLSLNLSRVHLSESSRGLAREYVRPMIYLCNGFSNEPEAGGVELLKELAPF
jgi:hypothetical protein